jgi:hypothetical protein
VYAGILSDDAAESVCEGLRQALVSGTISWRGNIRHVPTDADFNEETAWERVLGGFRKNRYQNGAYWSTPTGWVCYAVARLDEALARRHAREFLDDLRAGDFRRGNDFGAPFECMHPDGDYRQNPVYMTSVTCPLAAFRRLGWE